MDGVTIFLLVLFVVTLAVLSAGGRSRRDYLLRRQNDTRIEAQLHRTTTTDATGMLVCRRCGTESHERARACPRCGAPL